MKIDRFVIENVSGIPVKLEIPLDGKSLLLYGENGTGKSSIVQSIEYLITGRVGSLPPVQGRTAFDKRIRHRDQLDAKSTVECVFVDGKSLVRRCDDKCSAEGHGEEWLVKAQSRITILRRAHLLSFIEDKPGNRYAQVSQWLGVDKLDQALEVLKAAKDLAEDNHEAAKRDLRELTSGIAGLLGCEAEAVPDEFERAAENCKGTLELAGCVCPSAQDDVETILQALAKTFVHHDSADLTLTLGAWAHGLPAEVQGALDTLTQTETALSRAKEQLPEGTDEVDLLQAAETYLKTHFDDMCPLCERKVEHARLVADIGQRLFKLQAIQMASNEYRKAKTDYERMVERHRDAWESLALPSQYDLDSVRDDILARLAEPSQLSHFRASGCATLSAKLAKESDEEMAVKAIRADDARRSLNALSQWTKLQESREKAERLKSTAVKAAWLYQLAQEARRDLVQERLDAITAPVNDFYRAIHPDEEIEAIRIVMAEPTPGGKRDRSAQLQFCFQRQSPEDPRVHLSEGHLDTLGLAFYLANLKRAVEESGESTPFLVLDDVISSVDAPHRARVARELLQRFKQWQILLTTHDKIWFKRLVQISRNVGFEYHPRVIRRWLRDRGPDIRDHQELYEDLKSRKKAGDPPRIVVAEAGILLEELFNGVRQRFGLSIKGKEHDLYTLSELADPVIKALKDGSKPNKGVLPGWAAANLSVIAALEGAIKDGLNIRNVVGAHHNPDADEVTESEADQFAEAALRLYEAFVCLEKGCKHPVKPRDRDKTDAAHCGCRALVYPVPAPQPPGDVNRTAKASP